MDAFKPDQAQALTRVRLRWVATLLTNAPLPFVALPITGSDWLTKRPDDSATQMMIAAIIMGLVSLCLGLFARNQAYKAYWREDCVEPAGYLKGNTLFFLAVNAGAVGLFLVSIIIAYPAPTFAAAPVFAALLVINFPNGKPMRPAPPRINYGESLP